MFIAVFSGVSVVWDREFGFLREMLVAPIRRTSIMVGKCLGGAIVATVQSVVLLALAGLAGVPYNPALLAELLAILFLVALSITAFGLLLAARIKSVQSLMPAIYLDGDHPDDDDVPVGCPLPHLRPARLAGGGHQKRPTRSPTPCTPCATWSSATST